VHPNYNENARPVDPLARQRAAAEARVQAALVCLQDAQALLDRAGQELCSVRGMSTEWRRLGTLYEQVKGRWYAVQGRADRLQHKGRLLLDHEPCGEEGGGR
jgi:hypothetical protein